MISVPIKFANLAHPFNLAKVQYPLVHDGRARLQLHTFLSDLNGVGAQQLGRQW